MTGICNELRRSTQSHHRRRSKQTSRRHEEVRDVVVRHAGQARRPSSVCGPCADDSSRQQGEK